MHSVRCGYFSRLSTRPTRLETRKSVCEPKALAGVRKPAGTPPRAGFAWTISKALVPFRSRRPPSLTKVALYAISSPNRYARPQSWGLSRERAACAQAGTEPIDLPRKGSR